MSSSERLEGQSQKSSGADCAGTSLVSSGRLCPARFSHWRGLDDLSRGARDPFFESSWDANLHRIRHVGIAHGG